MASTIITKYGSGAPLASDLVRGELAVDTENKRLYTENSGGSVVELGTNPAADVTFADNVKAIFGVSGDLQIYHDGSNSYIKDLGTGDLFLSGNTGVQIQSDAGENMITTAANGAVSLFYDASAKLATTSTGIDVTGTVTTTGSVGIGTSSPASILHATGSTGIILGAVTGDTWQTAAIKPIDEGTSYQGTLAFYTHPNAGSAGSPTERMRIDSSGNLILKGNDLDLDNGTVLHRITNSGTDLLIRADYNNAIANSTIQFSVDGSEAMRIDSSGQLLLGRGANVNSGAEATRIQFYNTNSTYDIASIRTEIGVGQVNRGELVFAVNNGAGQQEAMRIDYIGRVGIGTASPSAKLGVNATAPDFTFLQSDVVKFRSGISGTTNGGVTGSASGDYFARTTGGKMLFSTNDGVTAHAVIDSSGNLLVGETSVSGNAEKFRITSAGTSTATAAALFNDSAGTELFFVRSDGAFRTGSGTLSPYNNTAAVTANCFINTDGTLVRATSSRRYKKDIVDARFGLSDVLNLRPVNYKGINSEVDEDTVYGGLIAEEVHDAGLTEFVEYNKENQPDALRYQHMVSLCIKAIQEQQDLIESLTARIAALEGAN